MDLPEKVMVPWNRFLAAVSPALITPSDLQRLENVRRAAMMAKYRFERASLHQALEGAGFQKREAGQVAGVLIR